MVMVAKGTVHRSVTSPVQLEWNAITWRGQTAPVILATSANCAKLVCYTC